MVARTLFSKSGIDRPKYRPSARHRDLHHVAHQNVDPAEGVFRLVDQALKVLLEEMFAGIGFAASRPRAQLMAAAVSAQASLCAMK